MAPKKKTAAQLLNIKEDNKFKNLLDSTRMSSMQPASSPPKAKNPEIFTDEKGNLSGFTLPTGETYLGLNPEEVRQSIYNYQKDKILPQGTQQVGTQANINETQARNQEMFQMAQSGLMTPQELQSIEGANLDVGQALGAGGIGVLPGLVGGAATGLVAGALGGATTGALAGTAITPVVGTAAGAILGAIGGFILAVRSNIKSQQVGEFAADQTALTKGDKMIRALITDTHKNPQNGPENIALFYQTLNMIDAAHAKTWKDSQENLNKFLGNDGTPQLAKFDMFDATMRQYYISQFEAALYSPNPNMNFIMAEDLLSDDFMGDTE